MTGKGTFGKTVALVAATLVSTFALAGPASAAGRSGLCHPWHDSYTAGGWCEGHGPNYTYQTHASCRAPSSPTFLYSRSGPRRSFGDKRKSYAYCAPGTLQAAWIWKYYKGKHYATVNIL